MLPRRLLLVLLFFVGSLPVLVSAADIPPGPTVEEWNTLRDAFVGAGEGRCEDVLVVVPAAVESDTFIGFPKVVRRKALEHLVDCLYWSERDSELSPYLRRLAELGGPDAPELLREVIYYSVRYDDLPEAVRAVKELAEYGLDSTFDYDADMYAYIHNQLRYSANSQELRYEFLRTLFEYKYVPRNPFFTADTMLLDYAAMAIDRGDNHDTAAILSRITEPGIILQARIDKRFDAIRQSGEFETFLDLENAADRYILKMEALVHEWPEYANGYAYYSRALLGAWRIQDALDVIEPIGLKVRAPGAEDEFVDLEFNKSMVLSAYSHALYVKEYPEQSMDMFQEAVDSPESDDINIIHSLNFAAGLLYSGEFERVFEHISEFDYSSANRIGRMWARTLIVCANAMSGTHGDYSAAMAYLVANEIDNPGALIEALLCTNDIEAAATHLSRRIQDPDQRILALVYLQDYRGPTDIPAEPHEHETLDGLSPGHILRHRFDRLREREDLLAVVNKYGRIEEVPLHKVIWFRF